MPPTVTGFFKFSVHFLCIFPGLKTESPPSSSALYLFESFCGSWFLQGERIELEQARQHLTMSYFHLLH